MQSTLPSVLQELRGTRLYLSDCLSDLYDAPDSQAETAGRVPELAGFTLMHQSRRMMQRPLSLQGVELADGNRFFINLNSQAETCARPIMFSNGTMQKPVFNTQSTSEEQQMVAVTTTSAINSTPFAWDFRTNSVDAWSTERNFDWPALDETEYRRPEPLQRARVWSKEPSLSRIPALSIKSKKTTVEVESLRELLQEAMDREAQRITLRTKVYKPEKHNREDKLSIGEGVKRIFEKIRTRFDQLNKNWTSGLQF